MHRRYGEHEHRDADHDPAGPYFRPVFAVRDMLESCYVLGKLRVTYKNVCTHTGTMVRKMPKEFMGIMLVLCCYR